MFIVLVERWVKISVHLSVSWHFITLLSCWCIIPTIPFAEGWSTDATFRLTSRIRWKAWPQIVVFDLLLIRETRKRAIHMLMKILTTIHKGPKISRCICLNLPFKSSNFPIGAVTCIGHFEMLARNTAFFSGLRSVNWHFVISLWIAWIPGCDKPCKKLNIWHYNA